MVEDIAVGGGTPERTFNNHGSVCSVKSQGSQGGENIPPNDAILQTNQATIKKLVPSSLDGADCRSQAEIRKMEDAFKS